MEISNNVNSVTVDIDKLTFKKDDGANSFLIDIKPSIESVTNANVINTSVPFESADLYLTGLSSSNKSILTKISNIDTSFDKIDASLIDLYNNGGGGGGGGGTFSGAATSLRFGSTSINLPSVIGTNGQTLLYNSSTGTFAWGEGGGSGGSNILTFGTTDKTLPTALGAHDQVIVYNGITQELEWGDRTTGSGGGGVSTTDFSLFIGKVDNSFSEVYEDIDRIDASINTRIDISLEEIKNSISNATNDNYYNTTILDGSFTDLSSVVYDLSDNVQDISATLETFRVAANSNFTTIINELATTNDKFDDNNARFLTVNSNFNAFDDIITDICNNKLKPLIDNSNALLIGDTYLQLPSSQPGNDQILKYINNQLIWTNDTGGSGGGEAYDDTAVISRLDETDASFDIVDASFAIVDTSFDIVDASFAIVDTSFDIVDASFVIVDTSFVTADASFVTADASFDSIHNSLLAFENILVSHDNSFATNIEPSLSSLNNSISQQNANHISLSNTVTDNTTRIGVSETNIQNISATLETFYSKTILDSSFTDITGKIIDLSNSRNDNDNLINNKIYKIDLSINRIDNSLLNIENNISSIENNITNIDTSIDDNLTSINNIELDVLALQQTNSGLSTQISNLNSKKTDYLDTADGHRLPMPATRPPGKALVVTSDSTALEWGNVSEITRDSDVNLLNLNVYGSTDVSGNIRVSDELIVGMVDAKESIRTKGIIKTNELTVHNIVFPNNLDHTQRTIDISQQDIYHDVSGIHITKSYLHDVDISGTVNILPTNSIITPLGVTIKFL